MEEINIFGDEFHDLFSTPNINLMTDTSWTCDMYWEGKQDLEGKTDRRGQRGRNGGRLQNSIEVGFQ